MADKRKLQAEIEKCNKKVQEGCDLFDDIWTKFNASVNGNQREKYEADLKKEIKKLQRLRDQIKAWLNANDIRDKAPLQENRKRIESRMEKFKVVEKETKTKAYSKEGLGAGTKLDAATKERLEMENWLQEMIEKLNLQAEAFDSELEQMAVVSGGKKKGKTDKDKTERADDVKKHLERHRFHIMKLETLLRMLDNDAVDVEKIKAIQDDVIYYVDEHQEVNFAENESLYDDLDLDETELMVQPAAVSVETISSALDSDMDHVTNHINKEDSESRKRHRSSTTSDDASQIKNSTISTAPQVINSKPTPTLIANKIAPSLLATTLPVSHCIAIAETNPPSSVAVSTAPTPSTVHTAAIHTPTGQAPAIHAPVTSSPIQSPPSHLSSLSSAQALPVSSMPLPVAASSASSLISQPPSLPQISYSNMAAEHVSTPTEPRPSLVATPPQSSTPNSVTSSQSVDQSVSNSSIPSTSPSPLTLVNESKAEQVQGSQHVYCNGPLNPSSSVTKMSDPTASLRSIAQSAVNSYALPSIPVNQPSSSAADSAPSMPNSEPKYQTSSIRLSPLLGVAPLGPRKLTKENNKQAEMLSAAYQHMPHPSDSERLRYYLPRNPCATPSYYPQMLPPHSDTVEFFQRLSTEALFFIFYYMEGTKAQYLAARALKKQSWRFHTKYMMWFQRHDEPRTITEECEQGTYIYFDYEKWGQRRKEGFTFEYRYLEDRELN